MRKLSELLPLARQHLRTATKTDGDIFVCFAADKAVDPLSDEGRSFSEAIYREMERQSPNGHEPAYLYRVLIELGTIPANMHAGHLDYIPHRDAWLDAWQARLEEQGL